MGKKILLFHLFIFLTLSGIFAQQDTLKPASISLQNKNILYYPNPASKTLSINYSLQVQQQVSIGIYNQIGQEVIHVIKEQQKEGTYTHEVNIEKLITGIYFIRINTGKEVTTRKLIID